jgi:hypothetical protein
MPWVQFESATPATKQPQTYALDHAATGIGSFWTYNSLKYMTSTLYLYVKPLHFIINFVYYQIKLFPITQTVAVEPEHSTLLLPKPLNFKSISLSTELKFIPIKFQISSQSP